MSTGSEAQLSTPGATPSSPPPQSEVTAADVWRVFNSLREHGPLVHNITNYVAMDVSANLLLAAGASPAMVHAPEEVAEFAGIASALVVNIGTLSTSWVQSMDAAVDVAVSRQIPWVLDPVAVGATAFRTKVAGELFAKNPTVVRANASEILALAGATCAGKGVDSAHDTSDAAEAARDLAVRSGGVVAATGVIDVVTDGDRTVRIAGGDVLMGRVTAIGCSASALVAAFAAVEPDAFVATVSALAVLAVAGERAALGAHGPGSFRVRLLDELYVLDEKAVLDGVRLT